MNLVHPQKQRFISFVNFEIINNLAKLEKIVLGIFFIILGFSLATFGEKCLQIVFSLLCVIALSLWVISLVRVVFDVDMN